MEQNNSTKVTIIDIQMPFWSMVVFMVKAVIASIPAFIILAILSAIAMTLLSGVFVGLSGH